MDNYDDIRILAVIVVLICVILLIWDGKKDGQKAYSASEREMEKLSWSDYFAALLVKSFRRSGSAFAVIIVSVIGYLVFLVMLLFGYDDMVPGKFYWLKQLFFWR